MVAGLSSLRFDVAAHCDSQRRLIERLEAALVVDGLCCRAHAAQRFVPVASGRVVLVSTGFYLVLSSFTRFQLSFIKGYLVLPSIS